MPTRRSTLARAEQAAARHARALDAPARPVGRADRRSALPERLPDLPPAPARAARHRTQSRWQQRLDVQGARLAARADRQNLGLTRTHALHQRARARCRAQQLERGADAARLGDRLRAAAVRLGRRARGTRRSDLHAGAAPRRRDRHQRALRGARGLHGAYRTAYDIARHHRDEIVPLRKRIADENLLRYNGMLIGVFELLADAREQIASVDGVDRRAARLLARPGRPRHGPDRQARPGAAAPPAHADGGRRPAARRTETRGATDGFPTQLHRRRGAVTAAVAAAAVSRVAMAALPEPVIQTRPDTMPPLVPNTGRPYNPVVTLERLDAALAHEQRREGVPPGRRAGGARDGARLQGAPVGLQRPEPGPDDRGGRRRPGAHLRHQQARRADTASTGTASACPTAWTA